MKDREGWDAKVDLASIYSRRFQGGRKEKEKRNERRRIQTEYNSALTYSKSKRKHVQCILSNSLTTQSVLPNPSHTSPVPHKHPLNISLPSI